MLELGKHFAFVVWQHHLEVGGQDFDLTAVDEQVRTPEESPSIGLLLCRNRDNLVAEYALRDLDKPIDVSRYELSATIPEELKASLPTLDEVEEGLSGDMGKEAGHDPV